LDILTCGEISRARLMQLCCQSASLAPGSFLAPEFVLFASLLMRRIVAEIADAALLSAIGRRAWHTAGALQGHQKRQFCTYLCGVFANKLRGFLLSRLSSQLTYLISSPVFRDRILSKKFD
jgi:hypothetical protein